MASTDAVAPTHQRHRSLVTAARTPPGPERATSSGSFGLDGAGWGLRAAPRLGSDQFVTETLLLATCVLTMTPLPVSR